MIAPPKDSNEIPRPATRLNYLRIAIPFLLLSAAGVIVWSITSTNHSVHAKITKKRSDIAIRKPKNINTHKAAPLADAVGEVFCYGKNGKVQIDDDGNKWFNGARVYDEGPGDCFLNGEKLNKPPIFRHRSERLIADLLQHPVGMPMPAAPNFAVDWDKDFVESLLDPIEIKSSDTDEVRQLKKDVIETKKEIVERIKAGENFSEIIASTQKEANRIAGIRTEMQRIYAEMKRSGASPQELKDHLDAANILLSRHGSIPLPISRKLLIELGEDN